MSSCSSLSNFGPFWKIRSREAYISPGEGGCTYIDSQKKKSTKVKSSNQQCLGIWNAVSFTGLSALHPQLASPYGALLYFSWLCSPPTPPCFPAFTSPSFLNAPSPLPRVLPKSLSQPRSPTNPTPPSSLYPSWAADSGEESDNVSIAQVAT